MSSPPEYQSLTQHDPDGDLDSKSQHVYPPVAAQGEGSSRSAASNPQVRTVTYEFVPRWPMKAEKREALGVLYSDRDATTQAIIRVFPELQEYDQDRVEILTEASGSIMDEAWEHITSTGSVRKLKVQVRDLPGDREKRERHAMIRGFKFFGGMAIFMIAFGLFLGLVIVPTFPKYRTGNHSRKEH